MFVKKDRERERTGERDRESLYMLLEKKKGNEKEGRKQSTSNFGRQTNCLPVLISFHCWLA